jgi:purine-binding chemotaxis protein CheW
VSPKKKNKDIDNEKITLSEEELYETNEPKEETVRLVVFRLSEEWYGVQISNVKEVGKVERISYLPSSPDQICGIVNLRGNILAVLDLKKVFNLPQEPLTEKSRLVVIEEGVLEVGLLSDAVVEVSEVPVKKIEPALSTLDAARVEYLTGQVKAGDKLIGILNVERILTKK